MGLAKSTTLSCWNEHTTLINRTILEDCVCTYTPKPIIAISYQESLISSKFDQYSVFSIRWFDFSDLGLNGPSRERGFILKILALYSQLLHESNYLNTHPYHDVWNELDSFSSMFSSNYNLKQFKLKIHGWKTETPSRNPSFLLKLQSIIFWLYCAVS